MTAALISAAAAVVVALIEALAARDHAGGPLLLLHVLRLYEPYSSTVAARDHAGGLLLFPNVQRLHENQTIYHSVRNIYQVVPHPKKRNRDNSFKFA